VIFYFSISSNRLSGPDSVFEEVEFKSIHSRGYTRDAPIRPNKPDRLRAEFSLFSLLLALLSIKRPFQPIEISADVYSPNVPITILKKAIVANFRSPVQEKVRIEGQTVGEGAVRIVSSSQSEIELIHLGFQSRDANETS
jgi:hypothetical protein